MSIKYRAEIDGLRAISIIFVILYHAKFIFKNISLFKGGFIGVDIFFVISGYLITFIILREVTEGTFSFSSFYERRARRILPSLFTVIIASIPLAWILMLPTDMKKYAGSILSTLGFSSNIWFSMEDSYTAAPSVLKPFLHTWSLSVEEQFYILFPIILILCWKFARNYITSIFALGFLLSLQLSEFGSTYFEGAYKTESFFLLPTRIWELLAGSILAKSEIDIGRIKLPFFDSVMSACGLFLIIYSIVFFDDQMPHPSFKTLIPILGAMLLIWFSKPGELIGDILGSKPFVYTGLISYSLYLWHVPIFAFAHIKYSNLTSYDKIKCIILSLILTLLTYYVIEKPARNRNLISVRRISLILGSIFMVLASIQSYFYFSDGVQTRYPINLYYPYEKEYRGNKCYLFPKQIIENIGFSNCQKDEIFSKNQSRVLLWGDSFAAHLYQGLKAFLPSSFFILQRTISSCPPLIDHWDNAYPAQCNKLNLQILEEVKEKQPEFIILSANWSSYEKDLDLKETIKSIKSLTKAKIIVVGPPPFWSPGLPQLMISNIANKNGIVSQVISYKIQNNDKVKEERLKLFVQKEKIYYFSMLNHICNQNKCRVLIGRDPVSWDYGHLTTAGSKFSMEALVKSLILK